SSSPSLLDVNLSPSSASLLSLPIPLALFLLLLLTLIYRLTPPFSVLFLLSSHPLPLAPSAVHLLFRFSPPYLSASSTVLSPSSSSLFKPQLDVKYA
ncbi:unnamed protein product, partial [Dibothriocephalus latus]